MTYPLDVMGPGEVAEHCQVALATVSKWQAAGKLPTPDKQLKQGPVWRSSVIRRWNDKRVQALRERFHV